MENSKEKQMIEEMAKCCTYYHKGECWADATDICKCDLMCEMFGVFTNLEAADYRKQEWISVEERLPDCCGMPVLMVAVNECEQTKVVKGFTDYACPIDFHTNEREFGGIWHAWKVTHWMPLPDAPKGE